MVLPTGAKKQHGMRSIVDKQTANSVLESSPVSKGIISIRIASKSFFNNTTIQVYATTAGYEEQIADELYEDLESLIDKAP